MKKLSMCLTSVLLFFSVGSFADNAMQVTLEGLYTKPLYVKITPPLQGVQLDKFVGRLILYFNSPSKIDSEIKVNNINNFGSQFAGCTIKIYDGGGTHIIVKSACSLSPKNILQIISAKQLKSTHPSFRFKW